MIDQNHAWNWTTGCLAGWTLQSTYSTPLAGRVGCKVTTTYNIISFARNVTRQGAIRPSFLSNVRKLTSVTTFALGFISQSNASTGVDNSGLLDNQTITVKTSNVASRVGKSNLVNFVGIQPDLAPSALQDVGRKALLEFQRDYSERRNVLCKYWFCHFKETCNKVKPGRSWLRATREASLLPWKLRPIHYD